MSEIELRLRKKAGKEASEIIDEIKEAPDYFARCGGANGTFPHTCFIEDFGHLMPEIVEFALECGGKI